MLWHAVAQQEGRALAFIVAEIRPVLRIADQSCQFRREAACDSWRICQPLIFIWLEPSETVTDDNPPPHIGRDVRAGTMRGGPEEADGGARRKNRRYRLARKSTRSTPVPKAHTVSRYLLEKQKTK